jgi:choline dehydrogenase-like flavoprotein
MAAYELSTHNRRVLLLEAGRDYNYATETPMFHSPARAPLRGVATPDKPAGYFDATVDGGYEVAGEPYVVAEGSEKFVWWRPRMLGGRTNHWGRVALRFGPYDLKPRSRDGLGFDWPLEYSDVAPWYDRVERLIGVTGATHGLENTPDSPEDIALPPPPPRAHEIVLTRAFESMGMKVAAMRAAILTKPFNGRSPCLYSTPCTRGCSVRATFQSTSVLISPAHETGNLTVRCNANVHRVDVDAHGRATGVSYFDRLTGEEYTVRGKAVCLAAGAFSSVRIMLNSRSVAHPRGLGNSTGLLGRHIMDTVEFTMQSRLPCMENIPPQNDDGIFTPHIYVPWWLYSEQASRQLSFPRGYHIEPRGGRRMPTMAIGSYVDPGSSTYGAALFDEVRRKYGTYVMLSGEGEMIPNEDTYCERDPAKVDKWGVPVLRFRWKWSDAERKQVDHMHATFNEVFRRLGGTIVPGPSEMPDGGSAIHEVGGARMGDSRESSVVNSYGRVWDAPNVFVLDGAVFASSPDKNPTLTILALASRGALHLSETL